MELTLVNHFISGGILVATLAVGLFFFRFWSKTRERLFLMFCLAFWLLAAERVALLLVPLEAFPVSEESRYWVYLIRLAAFGTIILGVLEKNRPRKKG